MKTTVLFLAVVGLASAGVIPVAPIVGHVATQYHAQDELGQYSYGYAGGPSAKDEIKTADGITRGGYTYIDGNGLIQSAAYVSDPVNGFRVAATNLPAGPAVPAGPETVAVAPTIPVAPATVGLVHTAPTVVVGETVLAKLGDQQPSTIIQSAVSPITIQHEAPAPVEEKNEESPEAPASEVPQENNGASADSVAVATIEQLVTPVQDTPEVQAAKAAHLAAVEAVKASSYLGSYQTQVRDAAQAEQDAQENNISKSDEDNGAEKADDSGEPESATGSTESTEAPAAAASPAAEPASAPAPEPVPASDVPVAPKVEVTPSIVATELAPAAPLPSSSFVPTVLVKEVVAAQAVPVPSVSLVAAPVAESVAVPAAAAPVAVPASAPVAVPGVIIGAPIAPSPSGPVALEHVGQITSQYHAQDELGQYAFGYSGGPSAKHELKTADGLTSGGYSYIDSHGLVQTAAYLSDPVNGFRVAATNIPQPRQPEYIADSPEVEEAKQQLFKAQAEHIAKL